jgi:hypothetical protein
MLGGAQPRPRGAIPITSRPGLIDGQLSLANEEIQPRTVALRGGVRGDVRARSEGKRNGLSAFEV